MASVSVLYIEDKIVGPHLELLRNICEPNSNSRPHITVRFFDKLSIPSAHFETSISHVDFLEPGSFGLGKDDTQENFTVFIRCKSDDLLPLEHKPYYPTSEFHVTIYDGSSKYFAKSLLALLRKYQWLMRVQIPQRTSLVEIKLKSRKKGKLNDESNFTREYGKAPKKLLQTITGDKLETTFLTDLSNVRRLAIVEKICAHLENATIKHIRPDFVSPRSKVLPKYDADEHVMHLTPPELALEITNYALKYLDNNQRKQIRFGDPAVGTGAFFAALLETISPKYIESAIGIDISPKHVEATKWRWASRKMEVILGDYLHLDDTPHRNFILANPPYLRHQGIQAEYKSELRQRASADLGLRISGLSGQYVYFILLSHKWMEHRAVAAWLIPSEFMQTGYGAALRYYFTHKVELIAVHQFDSKDDQFENAKTLPCVVFLRNTLPQENLEVRFSSGGTIEVPAHVEQVTIEKLRDGLKWDIKKIPKIERTAAFVRLGDLFSVRRGIATGANQFFVLERATAKELGIPSTALKSVLPKIRSLNSDIIERDEKGFPCVSRQLCVIDSDLPEDIIARKYPKFMNYLNSGVQSGVTNGFLVGKRRPWYKQEQREPCRFLCTYMGKAHRDKTAIRFIWNKSDAIAVNTYLMLYPNPGLNKLMHERPEIEAILFEILKMAAENSVSEFSREHAGGLAKIEPRELQEVWLGPLPNMILEVANRRLF